MVLNDLKYNISELDEHTNSYVKETVEYAKLKSFKLSMVIVTYFAKLFLLGIFGLLALMLLSLALSLALGTILNNTVYGFLIVGAVYLLLGVVFYLMRNSINRPILRIFSNHFFDDENDE
ncbi:MAG: hypothetical protein HKO75_06875 [Flavobacteriaceae bacterium]|nr:phage holin family protein [Muriicola sp.]NNC62117.1 hypothetical protein [Eudoraea sp.]NNK20970.1 hypothetical protein [Flavobacteriaceae bacterium]MBT8290853.1 phage holin family protein [Muriicola sp.]NNK36052.1 hypothetical protein [Eudoraea sp.]